MPSFEAHDSESSSVTARGEYERVQQHGVQMEQFIGDDNTNRQEDSSTRLQQEDSSEMKILCDGEPKSDAAKKAMATAINSDYLFDFTMQPPIKGRNSFERLWQYNFVKILVLFWAIALAGGIVHMLLLGETWSRVGNLEASLAKTGEHIKLDLLDLEEKMEDLAHMPLSELQATRKHVVHEIAVTMKHLFQARQKKTTIQMNMTSLRFRDEREKHHMTMAQVEVEERKLQKHVDTIIKQIHEYQNDHKIMEKHLEKLEAMIKRKQGFMFRQQCAPEEAPDNPFKTKKHHK